MQKKQSKRASSSSSVRPRQPGRLTIPLTKQQSKKTTIHKKQSKTIINKIELGEPLDSLMAATATSPPLLHTPMVAQLLSQRSSFDSSGEFERWRGCSTDELHGSQSARRLSMRGSLRRWLWGEGGGGPGADDATTSDATTRERASECCAVAGEVASFMVVVVVVR